MRELALHAPVKQIKRSAGRSSVAAAAYRAGTSFDDERTGMTHDYSRKQGVEYSRMYAPDHAPAWARDRERLWNTVEVRENKSNATVAHEWEIGFPAEFNEMQRREASHTLAEELVRRYACAVDVNHHLPSRAGDERNFHVHILFTTRSFDPGTEDGWAKTKYRDLSQDRITLEGERTTRGKVEIKELRAFVSDMFNDISERDGLSVEVEHLSFKARGIDQDPTQHLGPTASAMEREGKVSERGDRNREIKAANDNRAALEDQAKVIDLEIEREKRWLECEAGKDRLALARRFEAVHAERQFALDRDILDLTRKLDNQNVFQRIWGQLSGRNARMRDDLAGLQATLTDVKADREAERQKIHAFEMERRRQEEQQERDKQKAMNQEASNRAIMKKIQDVQLSAANDHQAVSHPAQKDRAGGQGDPDRASDLDRMFDGIKRERDPDLDVD